MHTIGGGVGADETIMLVVPAREALAAEVKVAPQGIDQVRRASRRR